MTPAMMVDEAAFGPLWPAVAASIALHAAVLAGLPDFWTPPEPQIAVSLDARLEPGPQVATPTTTVTPAPPTAATHDVIPPRARSTAPRAARAPREVPVTLPDRIARSEPARPAEPPVAAPVNSVLSATRPPPRHQSPTLRRSPRSPRLPLDPATAPTTQDRSRSTVSR